MARAKFGTIDHLESITARFMARSNLGIIRHVGNTLTSGSVKGWMSSLSHWEVMYRIEQEHIATVSPNTYAKLVLVLFSCPKMSACTRLISIKGH